MYNYIMDSIEKTIKKTLKKYNKTQKKQYKLAKSYEKQNKNKIKVITYAEPTYPIPPITFVGSQIYNSYPTEMSTLSANLFTQNNGLNINFHPNAGAKPQTYVYYTPQQINIAYGLNKLDINKFKRGDGMTIAVVIAYHYKNLQQDFDTYNKTFGLPLSTLKIISNTKIQKSNWNQECCLDVQAVHTVAPYANILVVEAASATYVDLLNAIKIAVANGVNVISMSWGGGENSSIISAMDNYFSSVQNVSFIASSGDQSNLVNYPSSSPNVLSVGGTNLKLNSDNTRNQEVPWYNSMSSGAGNGYSKYIIKPKYQSGISVLTANYRCTPDVALVADPYTGFAVCYGGRFYIIGGTSLAAPLCAGMIGIANQLRKSKNKSVLTTNSKNTSAEIHNIIYNNIYKTNINYSTSTPYVSNFYDVTTGLNGIYPSKTGFDLATGLGSLNANIICNTLANL
jgi:subtilase family serine protease